MWGLLALSFVFAMISGQGSISQNSISAKTFFMIFILKFLTDLQLCVFHPKTSDIN
jgi:hypothetical protein